MAAPPQPQLVFVDGSFADLAQEMADYLNVGDEVKPLIEKDQKDEVLKKIIIASPALNNQPEKEFTAAYNLLVYLVLRMRARSPSGPRTPLLHPVSIQYHYVLDPPAVLGVFLISFTPISPWSGRITIYSFISLRNRTYRSSLFMLGCTCV